MNTTAYETPIRQLGVDVDRRLYNRFGEIGDTYTLIGLAYLEGLNEKEMDTADSVDALHRRITI